tara:strand:- start:663 stop:2495 length:1833 start_codon:yes stop_codon:yes gene_type:complete
MSEKITENSSSSDQVTIDTFLERISDFVTTVYFKFKSLFDFPNQEECAYQILNLCFYTPTDKATASIFGFAEFIAALALLVVVYTITDVRYKFRIRTARLPLLKMAFFVISIVGFGSLITDFWMASNCPVLDSFITYSGLQFSYGFLFLSMVLLWLFFAFMRPPKFNKSNAKKYLHELYRYILQGSETELPVIAHELGRSAREIINLSEESPSRRFPKADNIFTKFFKSEDKTGQYAYEILLMIGTRRLCRYMAAVAPATVIEFFLEFSENIKTKSLPIGQFVRNISTEAILNKDSVLYHEDEGYNSGWFGYVRPFSKAVYGDYDLIEILSQDHSSPLDLDYKALAGLDPEQFEAYTRVTLITFEEYIKKYPDGLTNSYALNQAFSNIKSATLSIYQINNITDWHNTDVYRKFRTSVDFIRDVIRLLNKHGQPRLDILKSTENYKRGDMYGHVANLMFEIISAASRVNKNRDTCWEIHHNSVWTDFFNYGENKDPRKLVLFRLRRALYDEICRLSELPNYKSARILAICLNVMGPVIPKKGIFMYSEQRALHKAMIGWLKNNYLDLIDKQPDVANACIIGSISYDEDKKQIIKSYIKGLRLEESKEYLSL